MKYIKPGVTLPPSGVCLEILDALLHITRIYHARGYDVHVTSLGDGQHLPNSLHYQGRAIDIRTRHVQTKDLPGIAHELKTSLGADYDVVFEGNHFHVEYDPKSTKV